MKKTKEVKNVYSKKDLIKSKKYNKKQDLLNALLEDKEYSLDEVDAIIQKFMKGRVN